MNNSMFDGQADRLLKADNLLRKRLKEISDKRDKQESLEKKHQEYLACADCKNKHCDAHKYYGTGYHSYCKICMDEFICEEHNYCYYCDTPTYDMICFSHRFCKRCSDGVWCKNCDDCSGSNYICKLGNP